MDTMTKICPRCHQRRPRSAFAPSTQYPSGLAVWCRACQALDSLVRYKRQRGYLGPDTWPPPPRPEPEDADEMRIVQIVMVIMLVLGFLLLVKVVVHGATLFDVLP
jgi:hypothetical protein